MNPDDELDARLKAIARGAAPGPSIADAVMRSIEQGDLETGTAGPHELFVKPVVRLSHGRDSTSFPPSLNSRRKACLKACRARSRRQGQLPQPPRPRRTTEPFLSATWQQASFARAAGWEVV